MTAIRGYSRLAPLVVVALMLTVAGCSLGSSSQSSDQGSHTQNGNSGSASGSQARASSTQWSKYFPAEEGRVCTYYNSIHVENVLDIPSNDITAETKQKLKYTDVHRESDGTHFAIKRSGNVVATTESQDSASGRQTIPITARTYKYVLDDDGTVHAEPQVFSGQGVEASFDKFVVYPSIEDLKQGKSTSTSVTGKVRASNPETQAQLEKQLPSGQSAMKMRMEYTVTGVPPKEITTPAGKFTDVIGLSIKLKDVEALNANPEGDRQIDTLASVLTEVTGTDTIWFARDVGLVQAQKKGSFAASFLEGASTSGGDTSAGDSSGSAIPPLELQGCNGEASSEPTTEGSQPSSPEPEPTTDPETATPSGSQDPNTASSRDNGVDSDTGGDTGSSDDSGDSGEGPE